MKLFTPSVQLLLTGLVGLDPGFFSAFILQNDRFYSAFFLHDSCKATDLLSIFLCLFCKVTDLFCIFFCMPSFRRLIESPCSLWQALLDSIQSKNFI